MTSGIAPIPILRVCSHWWGTMSTMAARGRGWPSDQHRNAPTVAARSHSLLVLFWDKKRGWQGVGCGAPPFGWYLGAFAPLAPLGMPLACEFHEMKIQFQCLFLNKVLITHFKHTNTVLRSKTVHNCAAQSADYHAPHTIVQFCSIHTRYLQEQSLKWIALLTCTECCISNTKRKRTSTFWSLLKVWDQLEGQSGFQC